MTPPAPPERRLAFGQVARLYEQVRPGYPAALVSDVLDYAQLGPEDRILEVGAGTGKATRQFAPSGHVIVALEPSHEMAEGARAASHALGNVTVIETEFETWKPPAARFGLLIAAQAWHWIKPEVRYVRARAALRPGGALAPFWNQADWSAAPLRAALQDAYRETAPAFAPAGPMHPSTADGDLVADWEAEIAATPGFAAAEVRRYAWTQRYGAEAYVRLLSTHSDHVVLEPQIRDRLLARVAEVIERHGGEIEIRYVTRLCLARAA